jgi:hypothetical protein
VYLGKATARYHQWMVATPECSMPRDGVIQLNRGIHHLSLIPTKALSPAMILEDQLTLTQKLTTISMSYYANKQCFLPLQLANNRLSFESKIDPI